jgi:hypothetical protein
VKKHRSLPFHVFWAFEKSISVEIFHTGDNARAGEKLKEAVMSDRPLAANFTAECPETKSEAKRF